MHLRVVAGVGQFLVARKELGFQFRHRPERLSQERRADFANGRVQRIEVQEVQFREQGF